VDTGVECLHIRTKELNAESAKSRAEANEMRRLINYLLAVALLCLLNLASGLTVYTQDSLMMRKANDVLMCLNERLPAHEIKVPPNNRTSAC
jgi:hypothetical protein